MNMTTLHKKLSANTTAFLVGGTLVAVSLAFGFSTMAAEDHDAPNEHRTSPAPKQCPHDGDLDGEHGPPNDRRDFERRGYHEGPPPRGEAGLPPRRGQGRPEGPPPPRGEYGPRGYYDEHDRPEDRGGEDREHYGRRDEPGRDPAPDRRGYGEERDRGPGPDGARGPRDQGPGHRPGPPAFEDIDADGDGSISAAEFKDFHETHRPPHREGEGPEGHGPPPRRPAPAPGNDGPPPPPAQ